MVTGMDIDLSEAIARLASERDARQTLPALHERKAQTQWRLRTVEIRIHELQREIKKLKRNPLAGLFGNRELKLAAKHEEMESLEEQQEACYTELQSLEDEMASIADSLTDADELNRELSRLLDEKARVILEEGGEAADRFRELDQNYRGAQVHRQQVETAKRVGGNLVERLFSMTRAVGRARHKGVNSGAVGALAATAINAALQNQSAKPSIHLVIDGLEQFATAMNALQVDPDDRRSKALAELRPTLTAFATELTSLGVGGVMLDSAKASVILEAVQESLGLLEEFSAEARKEAQVWETQWREFVEAA